jgi:hypothetical protein
LENIEHHVDVALLPSLVRMMLAAFVEVMEQRGARA